MASARRKLKEIFGLEEFRPGQAEIVASVLGGQDTLAIMPTGAGKSLCYQLPAVVLPGTTVVVSPLISLMKDQTSKLGELGVEAAQMNSHVPASEQRDNIVEILAARKEFVLTTPERLATEDFRKTLKQTAIDLIVVDEAHCVSQWGHDFRPAYLEIKDAIRALGSPPVLALTATATPAVIDDILAQLGIGGAHVVNTGVFRPNLHLEVWRTVNEPQKRQHLARLLQEIEGTGIVYAATVRQVDLLYDLLVGLGFKAGKYHGRMPPKQRHDTQERFMAGDIHAIVATNAFGMGIDKPDIRFVIHYAMPGSLEAYYQEAGRGGRDGQPARCALFFQLEDRRTQLYFLGGRYPRSEDVRAVYDALSRLEEGGAEVTITALKAAAADVADGKVRVVLQLLKDLGVAKEQRGGKLSLIKRHLSGGALDELATRYRERHAADHEKLNKMMEYGQSARCRWKLLLEYFGERVEWERCDVCDTCRHPLEEQIAPPGEQSEAADS
jgi:ATP-dependent DNA helicase RecQ